jgi:hypothetical protein
MPEVASPAGSGCGLLERAVALVRLTSGRVSEDILAARVQHVEIDENDVFGNSTTVGIMFEDSSNERQSSVIVDNVIFGGCVLAEANTFFHAPFLSCFIA